MTSPYPVFIGFFIYSFGLGTLFPRIGDIQLAMGLGEGALGLALIGLPIGLQISLLVADRVLHQYSVRLVMIAGMAMIGISYAGAAFASTPIEFFFSLLFGGLAVAGCYTVIESWLQAKATNKIRARVFSIYRIADFAG
ncbi:MAG: MFS transporter, partial [Candidatus Puniceispirillaceae bacterium]